MDIFKELTNNEIFAPDDRSVTSNLLDALPAASTTEPHALEAAMLPPPRATDPTHPQDHEPSGLNVRMANDTRWNSALEEAERALKLQKVISYRR